MGLTFGLEVPDHSPHRTGLQVRGISLALLTGVGFKRLCIDRQPVSLLLLLSSLHVFVPQSTGYGVRGSGLRILSEREQRAGDGRSPGAHRLRVERRVHVHGSVRWSGECRLHSESELWLAQCCVVDGRQL